MDKSKIGLKSWIPGYLGMYIITSTGRVLSWKSGEEREIFPSIQSKNGHKIISLFDNETKIKNKFYVHRLVWAVFKRDELDPVVWIIHKDGDISNNNITNLSKKIVNVDPNSLSEDDNFKYTSIEDNGAVYNFKTKKDIAFAYGMTYRLINQALKTGEEIEVIERKDLK